ncbi:VOC family protein [Micromonospora sp. A200]|uniref:VOC family protein n=1 Tax=Micromonospora sp. A200 TaxID=2940568 RepID=UPI002473437C|nr:VOC family protein [Micromonospora sp. A200]
MTLQVTIDCADPRRMVAFWAEALGYVPEPPPDGHRTWRDYWAATGVPAEELPEGAGDTPESVVDPTGRGPRIWFQQVPEGTLREGVTTITTPPAPLFLRNNAAGTAAGNPYAATVSAPNGAR